MLWLALCINCKGNHLTKGGQQFRVPEKRGKSGMWEKNSHKNGKKGLQNDKIFCRITLYRHRPWPVYSGPRRSFPGAPREERPQEEKRRVEENRWSF